MPRFIPLVLLLALVACTPGNPATSASSTTHKPSTHASPDASTEPTDTEATAEPTDAEASPEASDAPVADGTPVVIEHAITVKKDGALLNVGNMAERVVKEGDKVLSVTFGHKDGYLQVGEYQVRFGYVAKEQSPTADGLEAEDVDQLIVYLIEGTGAIPKKYVGKPRTNPTTETLSIAGGKLDFSFKGELVPYPGINPDPSFVLEVEIEDLPLK